jgi:histidyl-tRNA synthetase
LIAKRKMSTEKGPGSANIDHLSEDAINFHEVFGYLMKCTTLSLNPYLVRGLDYYTKTVFEFFKR